MLTRYEKTRTPNMASGKIYEIDYTPSWSTIQRPVKVAASSILDALRQLSKRDPSANVAAVRATGTDVFYPVKK